MKQPQRVPRFVFRTATGAMIALLVAGCATAPQTSAPAQHAAYSFDRAKLDEIGAAVERAIATGKLPGAVFHLERNGTTYDHAWGNRALVPAVEPMTESTIFDAASITKVTATTPSIWILIERGLIGLDEPLSRYIPEYRGGWRDEVTIRHLLTHTSGLRPDLSLDTPWSGGDTGIKLAIAELPRNRPGYVFRYSDINFELLGEVVRRVSGLPLDEFAAREVFGPLKMTDTRFFRCLPSVGDGSPCRTEPPIPQALLERIAPTEMAGTIMLRGVVHDPTARRMGGVAGHAGLFTTAHDLSRYARMLLGGGSLDGVRILKPATVKMLTGVLSPPGVAVRRAGGFDLDSGFSRPRGSIFPLGSYGHTGFTGGFFWIDPWSRTFYVFLSNRVHPNGLGSVTALQPAVGTAAAEAARVEPLTPSADATNSNGDDLASPLPPRHPAVGWIMGGADASNGIDVLHATGYRALEGLRIGLITNPTGIDRAGNPSIDLLRSAPGVTLVALFSPEHGIRGTADESVADGIDSASGLPVYSLYGARRKPTAAQLADVDALVFDIQDVGTRFYTYISTLGLAMEAAADAKKKFFVLDRVDPIGGEAVEGPVAAGESSFVAFHPIAVRHGMTVGELARMFAAERHVDVELTVIPVRGWERPEWQDEAGLPWLNTSPNMRSLTEAGLYPGIGLLESAISVGRGTATPFEIAGAPYVDELVLARELNALSLPGIRFEPVRFTPEASIFSGKLCRGVHFVVTDRKAFQPVRIGLAIATTLRRLYGDRFAVDAMAPLLRNPAVLEAIRAARPPAEIDALWAKDLKDFRERRARYLLY